MKIMVVLGILAVPSAALAAGSPSQPRAINCTQLQLKPKKIVLSCGDAGTWLSNLKWSHWSHTQAVGTGNYTANNCKPDCATGHRQSASVKVTLSKPKTCPGLVNPAFKQAAFTYTGPRPSGAPTKFKFSCPLPNAY